MSDSLSKQIEKIVIDGQTGQLTFQNLVDILRVVREMAQRIESLERRNAELSSRINSVARGNVPCD